MTDALASCLPSAWAQIRPECDRGAIPALAKATSTPSLVGAALTRFKTRHEVRTGDARTSALAPGSVHLVVTSPPYWRLHDYPKTRGQLGHIDDYDAFVESLKAVWAQCFDALVPGGRLVCVVGDVCLSRRRNGGRHAVMPLHASIQLDARELGFDNLSPIIWSKIANVQTEAKRPGAYLGKPFEPNRVIKQDIEYLLMLRKPGGYRRPSPAARLLSLIPAADHDRWFRQIWSDIPGAPKTEHPTPLPVALAERLVRMFSFAGDTVLDPFTGTGSTQVAAKRAGRHSLGIDIEPRYHAIAATRLAKTDRGKAHATDDEPRSRPPGRSRR